MAKRKEKILDSKVKRWINNYDLKIDKKAALAYSEQVAEETCQLLVESICKKVGILTGITMANDILKYQLGMEDAEIETSGIIKNIQEIADLELQCLAIKGCNLSITSKKKLLDICINKFKEPIIAGKTRSYVDIFKEHLDAIYKQEGELPNRDINKVNMVRDNLAARPKKPFGRKEK